MFLCIVMGKSVKKLNSPSSLDGFVSRRAFFSNIKKGGSVLCAMWMEYVLKILS